MADLEQKISAGDSIFWYGFLLPCRVVKLYFKAVFYFLCPTLIFLFYLTDHVIYETLDFL